MIPNRVQISTKAAIIAGGVTILVAFITSYATANGNLADLRTEIAVTKTTENNHYEEVQKQIVDFRTETRDSFKTLNETLRSRK